jgi:Uma2 family endonuclease
MTAVLPRPSPAVIPEEDDASRVAIDATFERLVAAHPDLRIEQTADGEILVMPPTYSETGRKNFKIAAKLSRWIEEGGGGEGFGSSSLFILPNGAKLSPDVSWIAGPHWDALSPQQKAKFAHVCPDFVLELLSPTDRLSATRDKLHDYRNNGVRLGWLLDPQNKRVEIYRPGRDPEVLDAPQALSGEDVLPGFTLELTEIWE